MQPHLQAHWNPSSNGDSDAATPFGPDVHAGDVDSTRLAGDPDVAQLGLWADPEPDALAQATMDALITSPNAGAGVSRRARFARRALLAGAAAGLATTLAPARAHAIFGLPIPQIVIDFQAIANTAATVAQLRTIYSNATAQLNSFVANTKKLTSPYAWRNINTAVAAVDGAMASGQSLGYSVYQLPQKVAVTFPGYTYNPVTATADTRARHEVTLSTASNLLVADQATGVQLAQSMARLSTMKTQLAGAWSAQQAAEVNATATVMQAEELTLLRQQLLAQSSAAAVRAAADANRELNGSAAVQALFTAPARTLTTNPPVRPAMDPAVYLY